MSWGRCCFMAFTIGCLLACPRSDEATKDNATPTVDTSKPDASAAKAGPPKTTARKTATPVKEMPKLGRTTPVAKSPGIGMPTGVPRGAMKKSGDSPPAGLSNVTPKDLGARGLKAGLPKDGVRGVPGAASPAPARLAAGLSVKVVKSATQYKGSLRPGPLAAGDSTATYDFRRLQPVRRDRLGVVFQVWRVPATAGRKRRFDSLKSQYPGAVAASDIGNRSFRADFGDISHLVWINTRGKFIAAVACSDDVCAKSQQLTDLAKKLEATIP